MIDKCCKITRSHLHETRQHKHLSLPDCYEVSGSCTYLSNKIPTGAIERRNTFCVPKTMHFLRFKCLVFTTKNVDDYFSDIFANSIFTGNDRVGATIKLI